jgi:2-polyprenyl-3-methyl-5-hydroxy-6-metoxy-1,4-benzoquinol methylase
MPDDELQQWPKLAGSSSVVDAPRPGDSVYAESVTISGWVSAPDRDPLACTVRAWVDGAVIGETRALIIRSDVSDALGLAPDVPTGFRFLGRVAGTEEMPRQAVITVTATWDNENVDYEIGRFAVRLVPALLAHRPYGDVVHPEQTKLLRRENIYGSGPPLEEPGGETLQLIREYLLPHTSVVDVGCGAGAYGPALISDGHKWLGIEVNEYCCQLLEKRGLPFRRSDSETGRFPCADLEFDDAICIEVLEHTADPGSFLAELARCTKYRALFSVPNMEVIPCFSERQVVPWHLLEGDHKLFFTRSSLRELLLRYFARVEVFSYADHALPTLEGIPLHVHLFAIADK